MNFLSEITETRQLSEGLAFGNGKKAAFVMLSGHAEEDIEALATIEKNEVAIFVPSEWLLSREQMDQNWTINLPKGRGQETLYSTTFFWNPASDSIQQILEFANQKGWAVYTQMDDKLCMLVVNSRVAVDIDSEMLKAQFI
ncbi:MAG: hypothetical protein MRZ79_24100 [Bacteroidia bacterium]|nr:hypothetical protein [Bacteroidia bacterium]